MKRPLALASLTLALTLSGAALADDTAQAKAREAYKAATEKVRSGDLDAALDLFERAASLSPHAATHLAAGRTALSLGDKPRAADHYARALALGLEGQPAAEAKKSLAAASGDLATVRVSGTGGTARIDAGVVMPTPTILHGKPGPHALTLRRGGEEITIPIVLSASERGVVVLDDALRPRETAAPPPSDEPQPLPPRADDGGFPNGLTWAGVSGLALGVVAGGAAAGVGVAALSARDDFLASRSRDDHDAATALETGTNVAIGLGVGFAAIGAALVVGSIFLDGDAPETTADGVVIRF